MKIGDGKIPMCMSFGPSFQTRELRLMEFLLSTYVSILVKTVITKLFRVYDMTSLIERKKYPWIFKIIENASTRLLKIWLTGALPRPQRRIISTSIRLKTK